MRTVCAKKDSGTSIERFKLCVWHPFIVGTRERDSGAPTPERKEEEEKGDGGEGRNGRSRHDATPKSWAIDDIK